MLSSQYDRIEDDTSHAPRITHDRQYPRHVCPSNSSTALPSLSRDIDSGAYFADNHSQGADFTGLPGVRHGVCRQMNAFETITRSHGLPCQDRITDFACNPLLQLKSFPNTAWTDSVWTNLLDLPPAPRSKYHTDQTNPNTIEIQAAQMQTNTQDPFVPTGYPDTMPDNLNYAPFIDQRTLPSRLSSTPRLSHVTTPDSVFSTPQYSQAFGHGPRGLAGLDLTVTGEESYERMNVNMSASPLDSNIKPGSYFPGHRHTTSNDWLSAHAFKEEWTDGPDIKAIQHEEHAIHPEYYPSYLAPTSPDRFLTNNPSSFSPNKVLDQPNGALQYHHTTGGVPLDLSSNPFAMQPTLRTMNAYLPTNNTPFTTIEGQDIYNGQANSYGGDFNFNASPLYPTAQYQPPGTLYGFPTPQNALPTQNINTPTVNLPSNKARSTTRAVDLDDKLVKWRSEGMTYREIMKKGNWGLEESTLRGRYRTLTKNKKERLRKPVWNLASLSALVAGVDRFAPSTTSNYPRTAEGTDKVPWKKVADWMHRQKDCYLYGNATVKKKYKELVADQLLQHDVNQWRRANGELPF